MFFYKEYSIALIQDIFYYSSKNIAHIQEWWLSILLLKNDDCHSFIYDIQNSSRVSLLENVFFSALWEQYWIFWETYKDALQTKLSNSVYKNVKCNVLAVDPSIV